ncbi:hypothetical protein Q0N25_14335, partial [Staphylococcus aureus]|nr:hypothetical protein [Staphylococcus aureus]
KKFYIIIFLNNISIFLATIFNYTSILLYSVNVDSKKQVKDKEAKANNQVPRSEYHNSQLQSH